MAGNRQDADVVLYEVHGSAAWITLNRPQAMNALTFELVEGIGECLETARRDYAVRSVVIAANGPMFCAGADLKMARSLLSEHGSLSPFLLATGRLFDALAEFPCPVIAAVQAGAIAGGLELVLACDLVVAARAATFCDGHARYGLFPGAGGASRLPRKIGANRAKQLLFTAETWSAERMRECGVVNEIVEPEGLHACVHALTEQIGKSSPAGVAGMKRVVETGLDLSLSDALALELAECENHVKSQDFAEGLKAFAERREPVFGDR